MSSRIRATLESPRRLAALALFCAWAVFFLPHLSSDGVPYYRDNLLTILPFRQYIHERLLQGELPHWYPYEGLGVPFIGQIATATFHPHSLLFLPLAPALAVKWNVLLSYLLALAGAYRLGRAVGAGRPAAVAAAFAFAFGGYALGVSHNLVYLEAHATLVWVASEAVRLARRPTPRGAATVALAWALTFMSGDPQAFITAPILIAAALCFSPRLEPRTVALHAASALLAAGLICVELLPSMAISAESARELGTRSPTMGLAWALHPLRMLELLCAGFIPDEFRNRMVGEVLGGRGAVWATTVYAGALVLLLAAAGAVSGPRRLLGFSLAAFVALWLALGDHGGLLPLVVKAVPLFGKFRYPEKYLGLFWCALVPLVALGTERFLLDRKRWASVAAVAAAVLALLALLSSGPLVEWVWAARGRVIASDDPMYPAVRAAWRQGFLVAGAFVAASAVVTRVGTRASLVLPLLLFGDLALGNGGHLPLVPREAVEAPNPFAELIRSSATPPPRVSRAVEINVPSTVSLPGTPWVTAMRRSFFPNSSGLDRIEAFGANTPAHTARYAMLFYAPPEEAARTATHFHGCFATVAPGRIPDGMMPVAQDPETGIVLSRSACAPLAWLRQDADEPDEAELLERLRRPWRAADASVEGSVRVVERRPELTSLEVDAGTDALLVLNDLFAAGWEARVDGVPAATRPVNVAARGVALAKGRHEVEFEYRTPRLVPGALASAMALVSAMYLVIRRRRAEPGVRARP